MGRPKLFNESQVLSAAMEEFWKKGFTATSAADLTRVTQLKPGSIYHQYGDKKGLFVQTLSFYVENVVDQRVREMLNHEKPLAGIEHFFSSAYEGVKASCLIGCLMTNTTLDQCVEDPDIKLMMKRGMATMEKAFEARLSDAIEHSDLPIHVDTKATAAYLVACFQGLMVVSRLTRNKARLRTITQQTMLMLNQMHH